MSRSRLLLDCAKTKGRTKEANISQGRMLKRVGRLVGRFNLGSRMKVEMKIAARDVTLDGISNKVILVDFLSCLLTPVIICFLMLCNSMRCEHAK